MNKLSWRTWSGTTRCAPDALITPRTEAEIVAGIALAAERGLSVRVAGTGHSFNRLVCTDGVILDLSRYRGVTAVDPRAGTVTVRGGTSLRELIAVLRRRGLALANVGTLAEQTVAGAISTGNHGSGLAFGPFASQVTRLRLITAAGAVLDCDAETDPDLFRCARTSLGALGVISTVTLRCVPAFGIRTVPGSESLDGLLERFDDWAGSADHVTASWLPWRETVSLRAGYRTSEAPTRNATLFRYLTTIEEVRCGIAGLAGPVLPAAVPWLTRVLPPHVAPAEYVDLSHRVFTFPQPVKFVALEHALPLASVPDALRELRTAFRGAALYSPYSVLVRVGAGDDAPLSPAFGRATGYVNLTVPRHARYTELLRIIEHVLRGHGARPHWGKAHTADAEMLRPRYPEWDTFQRMRGKLDPTGLFTNDYLTRVLGRVDGARWTPEAR